MEARSEPVLSAFSARRQGQWQGLRVVNGAVLRLRCENHTLERFQPEK